MNKATGIAFTFLFDNESGKYPEVSMLIDSAGVDCSQEDVIRRYTDQIVPYLKSLIEEKNSEDANYLKNHFGEIDFGAIFMRDSDDGKVFADFRVSDPSGKPIGNFVTWNSINEGCTELPDFIGKHLGKSKIDKVLLNGVKNVNDPDFSFHFTEISKKFGSIEAAGRFEMLEKDRNLVAVAVPKTLISMPMEKVSEVANQQAKKALEKKKKAKIEYTSTSIALNLLYNDDSGDRPEVGMLIDSCGVDCSMEDVIRRYTDQIAVYLDRLINEQDSAESEYLKEHFWEIDFGALFMHDSDNGKSFANFIVNDPFGKRIGNFVEWNSINEGLELQKFIDKHGDKSKIDRILLNGVKNINDPDFSFYFADISKKFGSIEAAGRFEMLNKAGNLVAVIIPKPLIDVPLEKVSEIANDQARMTLPSPASSFAPC